MMATFAFYTQGLHTYLINKTFFSLCSYFKSKDISFSNCKALKQNKRQERTKGIEPSTQESPKQQNQTKSRYHQLLLPAGPGSQSLNKAVLMAKAVHTAAVSPH